jgi:hypothetical protein
MQFYTQEELEKVEKLSKTDIEQCFIYLNKLIIHDKAYAARDYCNTLGRVIQNTLTNSKITVLKETKVPEVKTEQFQVETFFDWSAYEETCHFCKKIIPARTRGHGIFADHKLVHKWCEDCGTEEHKKHPYYKKYRG